MPTQLDIDNLPTLPPLEDPPIPQSTVNTPVSPAPLSGVQRDMAREQATIQDLGVDPMQVATLTPKLLFERTYTSQELEGIEDYQSLLHYEQSQKDLLATPRPINTMLMSLQNALRVKNDPAATAIGPSELYGQAGIPTEGVSGYTTLMQSLQNQEQYAAGKYNSFVNKLAQTAGAMKDTYQAVADKYNILKADYDRQANNMQATVMQLMRNDQAMQLLDKQFDLDKDAQKWATDNPTFSEITSRERLEFDKKKYAAEQGLYGDLQTIVDNIEKGTYSTPEELMAALSGLNSDEIGSSFNLDVEAFTGFIDEAMKVEMGRLPEVWASTENALGTGVTSGYGSKAWGPGLDFVIQGGKGAAVPTPIGGTVIGTREGQPATKYVPGEAGSFGNRVMIKLDDGNVIQLAHLDTVAVQEGDRVEAGQIIGTQGNTGTTYGPTGIHVDATMKDEEGNYKTAEEVQAYLRAVPEVTKKAQNKFDSSPDWFKDLVERDYMFSTESEIKKLINERDDIEDDEKKKYVSLFNDIINEPIRKSGLGVGAGSILRQVLGFATGNMFAIPIIYNAIVDYVDGEYVGFVDSDETWKERKVRLISEL